MRALARAATNDHIVSLVGGATAVLEGWRDATVDIDLALVGECDDLLRAIPAIKQSLEINVELASPGDFIPLPAGWEARAVSIGRVGRVVYLHFDPYSQALAKLERGHDRDLADVRSMIVGGLVETARLITLFAEIEPDLYRFPAIDPDGFRRRVAAAAAAI
jgi:hypothetical protein